MLPSLAAGGLLHRAALHVARSESAGSARPYSTLPTLHLQVCSMCLVWYYTVGRRPATTVSIYKPHVHCATTVVPWGRQCSVHAAAVASRGTPRDAPRCSTVLEPSHVLYCAAGHVQQLAVKLGGSGARDSDQ